MKRMACGLLALGCLWPSLAAAQISFQSQMLVVEALSDSGTSRQVGVINSGKESKEIWLKLEYRWQGLCPSDPSTWVSVTPAHLVLAPGENRMLEVKFKKPVIYNQGECHLVLLAREVISSPVILNVEVGIPVLVQIDRGVPGRGEITRVEKVPSPLGGWEGRAEVKNTGNMFLVPFGLAWIENLKGERVWQTELRLGRMLAPGSSTWLNWNLAPGGLAPGNKMRVQLFWGTMYSIAGEMPQSQTVSLSTAP